MPKRESKPQNHAPKLPNSGVGKAIVQQHAVEGAVVLSKSLRDGCELRRNEEQLLATDNVRLVLTRVSERAGSGRVGHV